MSEFEERVTRILTEKYGKLQSLGPLIYGTAGFRMDYYENPCRAEQVAMICSLIACLRSILEQNWVGVMITASHNPIQDNGVKIVDVTGSMLNKEFEQICFNVVNHEDGSSSVKVLTHYFKEKLGLNSDELNNIELSKAKLIVGYDTRPSSKCILESIERVASEFKISKFLNFGFTTTPQLHFMVAFANGLIMDKVPTELRKDLVLENLIEKLENCNKLNKSDIVSSLFELYFAYHEYYFKQLVDLIQSDDHSFIFVQNSHRFFRAKPDNVENYKINDKGALVIDVANGVGKYHVNKISEILSYAGVSLKVINRDEPEKLNDGCGAEHIQKNILPPVGFYSHQDYDSESVDYVAAFDGDADRLVYFAPDHFHDTDKKSGIFLIDGDRISACYALVIVTLLNQSIRGFKDETYITPTLSIGVVQTAYANGASTKYLNSLLSTLNPKYFRFSMNCVPTGVKHLHRKAEEYDIAIYFEANGHGTVIHKQEKLKSWVEKISVIGINNNSYKLLIYFLNLFNPVIGDAISDMLAFEIAREFVQARFGCKFSMCLYDDLKVIQDKVYLKRCDLETLICDKETEKFLVEPKAIQKGIDNYISNLNDNYSRAFIRPSGTEEVARIYVESPTLKKAQDIMKYIKDLIKEYFSKK
ncbi:phosphoacetyl glucosamine mutase [Cryptosporidium ubiquitum]|uniref:Phosphoacetylglucosamine mutase n=1 Tax=Cryptosporidium ubiquitum TaxID=857276 RepID=A0A1J4MDT8_9CRYT|nr:phosphoacetyl glucosamine mutase [Cryptosporidium ubiquitum]OII72159.1 phosphoacetyl glucosamine mutase [Cryptosporidium ubiquitum]